MRNTILSSVRQSLCSARFWLGAVFIALVLFLTSMDAVTEALRSDTPLAYGYHGDFILKALNADAITICLPIVCALPYAAASGSAEIVRLLLALGADPNIQEPTYGSPLLGAARFGYLEVVSLLLDQGADPKQVYWDDKDNILIEVAFGSNRILGQLIEAGAEINYQNAEGQTPLHYAVLNNRPENVRTLLEEGAYPNVVDSDGNTALDLAEQEELREIISILEEYNATVK